MSDATNQNQAVWTKITDPDLIKLATCQLSHAATEEEQAIIVEHDLKAKALEGDHDYDGYVVVSGYYLQQANFHLVHGLAHAPTVE